MSYRVLNRVTLDFEYPIGRCDTAIDDLGGCQGIYFSVVGRSTLLLSDWGNDRPFGPTDVPNL